MSTPQKKNQESSGSPAWMGTFADLMSLLMCFFVLLLSFSEMDLQKYKQVAGSMKMAFGIQREVKGAGTPKGTSIIAREYSPGKPQPTILRVIKQESIDSTNQTLDFTDAKTESKKADDIYEEAQGGSPFDNDNQSDIHRSREVKERLGREQKDVVLMPLMDIVVDGMTVAAFPWCHPFSDQKLKWVFNVITCVP